MTKGKIIQEIEIGVSNSDTLQTIIDNANTSYDIQRLLVVMMKYHDYESREEMTENFGADILCFSNNEVSLIFRIINGIIEENKKLKEYKKPNFYVFSRWVKGEQSHKICGFSNKNTEEEASVEFMQISLKNNDLVGFALEAQEIHNLSQLFKPI